MSPNEVLHLLKLVVAILGVLTMALVKLGQQRGWAWAYSQHAKFLFVLGFVCFVQAGMADACDGAMQTSAQAAGGSGQCTSVGHASGTC